jgi:hypothetical protein
VHQDLTDTRAGVPLKAADPLPSRPYRHALQPPAEIGIAAAGESELPELVEKFPYVQKGNLPARRQSSLGISSRDLAFGADLPDERFIAEELERSRQKLEERSLASRRDNMA